MSDDNQFISLGIPEKKAKDNWLHVQLQTQWTEHQILLRTDISVSKMVDLLEMSLYKRLYRLPGKDDEDDFREAAIKKYTDAVDALMKDTNLTTDEISRKKFVLAVTILERRITDQLDRYGGITHNLKVAKGAIPFWNAEDYTKEMEEEDEREWLGTGAAPG